MSKKATGLEAELERINEALGGSPVTRQGRERTFRAFISIARELDVGLRAAKQIDTRHLRAFVEGRTTQGISPRTLANELSFLRAALRHAGNEEVLSSEDSTNQELGLARRYVALPKRPLSDAALRAFRQSMAQLGRPGIGETLNLQRAFGLRPAEAIRAGQRDTLTRWQRELEQHGYVRVEDTRGGQPRKVHPPDLGRAVSAIRSATAVLEATGQRCLVVYKDGSTPENLRRAYFAYCDACSGHGIQTRSAQHAFAQERIRAYCEQGYSEREARSATGQDMGYRVSRRLDPPLAMQTLHFLPTGRVRSRSD